MYRIAATIGSRRRRPSRLRPVAVGVLVGFLVALTPSAVHGAPGPDREGYSAESAIVHGVPRVPLTIDGASVSPEAILEYNGQPLYMAAMPGSGQERHLAAFTQRAEFELFVRERGGPAHALAAPKVATATQVRRGLTADSPTGPSPQASGGSYIYEHAGGNGHWMWVPNGYGWPDLTQHDLTCVFVICTSWNDQASSARPDTSPIYTPAHGQMLWANTWWGGSALWIPQGSWISDLGTFGWNDNVSSFASYAG